MRNVTDGCTPTDAIPRSYKARSIQSQRNYTLTGSIRALESQFPRKSSPIRYIFPSDKKFKMKSYNSSIIVAKVTEYIGILGDLKRSFGNASKPMQALAMPRLWSQKHVNSKLEHYNIELRHAIGVPVYKCFQLTTDLLTRHEPTAFQGRLIHLLVVDSGAKGMHHLLRSHES